MSPDKVLHKIQVQIKDIAPALEMFVEHTIHPTVHECENLQAQLSSLQENLVIYKHLQQDKELSPSFNIHARVSEAEKVTEKPAANTVAEKTPEAPVKPGLKEAIAESIKTEPAGHGKPISVGINDKFRFINELFAQNNSEYAIAVEQLNTLRSWHDAEIYLSSLKSLYDWKENSDITKHFYAAVKKRFD